MRRRPAARAFWSPWTAVVHNDVPLAQLLDLVDEVIRLLVVEKRSVLSVCRNGAHRSATLLCLTLMRLFGWTAQECERHATQLRNIVDMRSRAPPSARRVNTVCPVDWLAEVSDQVRQDRPVYDVAVNQMCTPLQLTQKALSLGFVNRCFVRCESWRRLCQETRSWRRLARQRLAKACHFMVDSECPFSTALWGVLTGPVMVIHYCSSTLPGFQSAAFLTKQMMKMTLGTWQGRP